MANEIYTRAAFYFKDNRELESFLTRSAEDEVAHYHALDSAAAYYRTRPIASHSIAVDNETKKKIEGIFADLAEQINIIRKEAMRLLLA